MVRRKSNSNRLGTTFAFPLQLDPRGGFLMATGVAAVESHLRSIIAAVQRRHLAEPWFGIKDLPFLPISQTAGICAQIARAIKLAEDRIYPDMLDVRASEGGLDAGLLPIAISFVIRDESTTNHFTVGFRLLKEVVD